MRISDWSSDVCSSDLPEVQGRLHRPRRAGKAEGGGSEPPALHLHGGGGHAGVRRRDHPERRNGRRTGIERRRSEERRVGKSVSVRVALGGRRIIKKKKKTTAIKYKTKTKN